MCIFVYWEGNYYIVEMKGWFIKIFNIILMKF